MLLVALVIGTVFALSELIVTERNAKYLLAGYNTLPAQEREQIDIRSYVRHFRRFCILLGGTLFLSVAVLTALGAEVIGGVVTIVYPVIACMYLV